MIYKKISPTDIGTKRQCARGTTRYSGRGANTHRTCNGITRTKLLGFTLSTPKGNASMQPADGSQPRPSSLRRRAHKRCLHHSFLSLCSVYHKNPILARHYSNFLQILFEFVHLCLRAADHAHFPFCIHKPDSANFSFFCRYIEKIFHILLKSDKNCATIIG